MFPPVTVVIVTTQPTPTSEKMLTDQELSGPVLRAIKSVEEQDYSGPVEKIIVRNVQNHSPREMQRYGVSHASTEWIAFINEYHQWLPWTLRVAMGDALLAKNLTSFIGHYGPRSITLVKRNHYLTEEGVYPV